MKSVPSYAGHKLSENSFYLLGILRLLLYNIPMEGQIDLKHMKKAEKKALRLAVVTSLMGACQSKLLPLPTILQNQRFRCGRGCGGRPRRMNPKKAIQEGQRGRRMGACRTLTPDQEEKLQAEIVGKTPDQYQYEFALWSSQAVKLHILKRFGIDMPDRTVRFYLKRWLWTPQHPIRKAHEQNPKATQEWLETTYPAIKEKAKENKGMGTSNKSPKNNLIPRKGLILSTK